MSTTRPDRRWRADDGPVLVVTSADDATADAVVAQLDKRACPFVRFDIADFPQKVRLATVNDGDRWSGTLAVGSDTVDVEAVRSMYYRRPGRFVLPPGLSPGDAAFAMTEARFGFGGALSAIDALWVNHPARVAFAEYKSRQLTTAAQAGFSPPRTLITNDLDALREFASALDGPVVCKTFSSLALTDGQTRQTVFTTIVDPLDVDREQLAVTAHLFQEWVPKAFEARVTMVGDRPLAAAIHSDSDAGHLDWRADYGSLRYRAIDPPSDVVTAMRRYLREFGLAFGAFDFVVQPDGAWRFLECNPNGQWLWLEHETGLPISEALAELLENGDAL